MKETKELIENNPNLLELFLKRNEYLQNRPDRYVEYDYQLQNFNVHQPEISKFLIEQGLKIEYPENKKFAVCLTHDVDDVYPPLSHMLLSSLYCMKNFNFNELKNQLFWKNKGKEFSPYWNFKEIMKLEEKYEAKSSFYFIATDKDIKRFRYDIEDLENDLGNIVDNGGEVGLHGGYYSYNSLEDMKTEKERLEKVLSKDVIGYRNHYLRFRVPDTWELLAKAGFKYDTTFGYNDMCGFRNGMCHPFNPFNLNSNQTVDILEIPLVIMDSALFSAVKPPNETWEKTKQLIDTVEKYNGVLTLSWHNNVFSCPFMEKRKKLYEKTLEYCHEKNAWLTNGIEIYGWWKNII